MKQLGSEGSFPEPCAPHPFILAMGSSLTALPLLHHTGVSGAISHWKYSLCDMERGCGRPCHSVCGMSPEIFSGISLYCLKESVLGSGGWGQMMRKILISQEECWAESSLENYKSSWSELAVSYV